MAEGPSAVQASPFERVALREDATLADFVLHSPQFLAHPDRPILVDPAGRFLTPRLLRARVHAARPTPPKNHNSFL